MQSVHRIELRLAIGCPLDAHLPFDHHVHEHVVHAGKFGPPDQRGEFFLCMGTHGAGGDEDFLAFIVAQKRR